MAQTKALVGAITEVYIVRYSRGHYVYQQFQNAPRVDSGEQRRSPQLVVEKSEKMLSQSRKVTDRVKNRTIYFSLQSLLFDEPSGDRIRAAV